MTPTMTREYIAQFVSTPLLPILQGERFSCRVVSVHARACNLEVADGRLMALVTPEMGRGPFHVGVPFSATLSQRWSPGEEGYIRKGVLHLPSMVLHMADAPRWSPYIKLSSVAWSPAELVSVARAVLQQPRSLPAGSPDRRAAHLLSRYAAAAASAWVRGQRQALAQALGRLVGLGPGLTPAGDDVIVGLLAGRWLLGEDTTLTAGWTDFCELLAGQWERTHRLSRAWLEMAVDGAFAEPWHRVAAALTRRDVQALRTALIGVLSQGSTSGYYALMGFTAIMHVLK